MKEILEKLMKNENKQLQKFIQEIHDILLANNFKPGIYQYDDNRVSKNNKAVHYRKYLKFAIKNGDFFVSLDTFSIKKGECSGTDYTYKTCKQKLKVTSKGVLYTKDSKEDLSYRCELDEDYNVVLSSPIYNRRAIHEMLLN